MAKVNKKKNLKPFALVILLLVIVFSLAGVVGAKYIHEETGINIFKANHFYFTSDMLEKSQPEYVLAYGTTELTFTLGNNRDELNFSEADITYIVEVTGEDLGPGDPVPTITGNDGTLEKDVLSKDTIKVSGLVNGKTYIVTAKGQAGYKSTLSAKFKVSDSGNNIYKYLETDPTGNVYAILTVWTENLSGDVSVSYIPDDINISKGLIPDNTEPMLSGVNNFVDGEYKDVIFTDDKNFEHKYSSKSYRFFLDSSLDKTKLDVSDFKIFIEDTGVLYEAEPSTP